MHDDEREQSGFSLLQTLAAYVGGMFIIAGTLLLLFFLATLWPFRDWIGKALLVVLGVVTLCGLRLLLEYTSYKCRSMRLRSQLIVEGEVVAYHTGNGEFNVVSAVHEAAKVPQLAPVEEEQEEEQPKGPPLYEKEKTEADRQWEMLDLLKQKVPYKDIAERVGSTEYKVRKFAVSQGYGRGSKSTE